MSYSDEDPDALLNDLLKQLEEAEKTLTEQYNDTESKINNLGATGTALDNGVSVTLDKNCLLSAVHINDHAYSKGPKAIAKAIKAAYDTASLQITNQYQDALTDIFGSEKAENMLKDQKSLLIDRIDEESESPKKQQHSYYDSDDDWLNPNKDEDYF